MGGVMVYPHIRLRTALIYCAIQLLIYLICPENQYNCTNILLVYCFIIRNLLLHSRMYYIHLVFGTFHSYQREINQISTRLLLTVFINCITTTSSVYLSFC